jgi:hypothetical protein
LLQSAKDADARRHTAKQLTGFLGGALDTAPVLREFLQSIPAIKFFCKRLSRCLFVSGQFFPCRPDPRTFSNTTNRLLN